MAQVIARIYAAPDKAAAAANAVRALGYNESEVFVFHPAAHAAKADVAAAVSHAGFGKLEAEACADEVLKGRTIVAVHAAFGGGAKATAALDKFGPMAAPPTVSKVEEKAKAPRRMRAVYSSETGIFTGDVKLDDATPLSNWFKWPTLLNSATPFSDLLKAPTLKEFNSNVQLSDEAAPLSKKLGLEVLRDDPAPLSSKMNWPVIKE